MKKKLLIIIPIILVIAAILYYFLYDNNTQPNYAYYRVNFYKTHEAYCNCVDCDCPTGPEIYKSFVIKEGDKVPKQEDLSEEGKKFLGWVEDGKEELFDFDTPITRDWNLYAKYEPLNDTFKVTFYLPLKEYCNCVDCGCPTGPKVYKQVEVMNGEVVTKPDDPTEEVRKFVGWTKTIDGDDLFDFDTPITSDLDLYAKWREN